MDKRRQAELTILSRVLYLLEERSVSHLGHEDQRFNAIISDLYEQVSQHAAFLKTTAR